MKKKLKSDPFFIQQLIDHGILAVERHPTDSTKDKLVATEKTDNFIKFMEVYRDNKKFKAWADSSMEVMNLGTLIEETKGEIAMLEKRKVMVKAEIEILELLKKMLGPEK